MSKKSVIVLQLVLFQYWTLQSYDRIVNMHGPYIVNSYPTSRKFCCVGREDVPEPY
jgi:hypothetical protein